MIRVFIPFASCKVNVIARLEFELAYYDVTVNYVCHLHHVDFLFKD